MTPERKTGKWWEDWEFAKRIKRLPQQIVTDVKETASDIIDEPGEVPYRVGRRALDLIRGTSEPPPYKYKFKRPDNK